VAPVREALGGEAAEVLSRAVRNAREAARSLP
jgi:hypothetical protein